ncbi:MAG: cupin domain-containing protein [Candidatus Omnitrophota bacterium]|nr:cupin domain-containing protein [Candidatus Omnitrophota bacterium]MDZ4242467.1 cupin domain-containing protein [Candidatus Omnitrophota bacterium]
MSKIKIERLDDRQKKDLAIPDAPRPQGPWSVWECKPSTFDWHYDRTERAFLYEGKVKVSAGGEQVELKAGDFVTFPKGLSCTWDITETIRKVYKFES